MKDLGLLAVAGDSTILSVIERLFSHFNVKVDCVGSTTEALDHLKTKDCRTMITNLDIPDMGGLELARKARELFPDLNVVLFTGNTTEQVINLAFAPKVLDISGVHIKPCDLEDMLMTIMKHETGKTYLLE